VTPTSIRYKKDVEQVHINEIAKRSDILITSTLSVNMIPKDARVISEMHQVHMTPEDLVEYVDEKNAFKAMEKEHEYQIGMIRDKDKEFRENYLKSFVHRRAFDTQALTKFKNHVRELNRNRKQAKPKDPERIKLERIKHEQNKKACEKRTAAGLP